MYLKDKSVKMEINFNKYHMSKITTEDCKNYLINYYEKKEIITQESEWKRVKKYKNEDGLWVRDFEHKIIGMIHLIENNGQLMVVENPNVKTEKSQVNNDKNKSVMVDLISFDPNQIKMAVKAYTEYYKNNDDERDDDVWIKENYKKIQFIPGILKWYVPEDTYKNGDLNDLNLEKNMNGFFISMFDIKGIHDYGGEENLLKGFLPSYLSKVDEYNYCIEKDISFIDLVKDLSSFGYEYANNKYYLDYMQEKCLAKKVMKKIDYNKVKFIQNPLEEIFLNDDVNSFIELEKTNQVQKNDLKNKFYILADKYNSSQLLTYLLKNDYTMPIEEINKFQTNKTFVFNEEMKGYLIRKNNVNEFHEDFVNYVIQNFIKEVNDKNYDKALISLKLCHEFAHSQNTNIIESLVNEKMLSFNEVEVLPIYVKFFSMKDESVKLFILYNEENFGVFKYKEIRDSVSKDYVEDVLEQKEKERFNQLKSHKNSGFEMVMTSYSGKQITRTQQLNSYYNEVVSLKNKILEYFNNDENKPKYRTKF